MSFLEQLQQKIMTWEVAAKTVHNWKYQGEEVVFTNGCFDILHYGHLHYLAEARDLGTKLVIGLNSAGSVCRLKGPHRPINDEMTRQANLAALAFVDSVVIFEQDTPFELIQLLLPDVLVKGGDYTPEAIVGADVVEEYGGRVTTLPFIPGYSTTAIENKIRNASF
jgi:D-beta-D-heptose 7-phosphate kinase/D-beta-D-heptose 1-phosphate adenosyltransferase